MTRFDLRRDAFVLGLLAVMLVLLASGLVGAYQLFGYALVAFLGMLAALGFVRRGDPVSWVPPILIVTVLVISFAGLFANEAAVVRDARDTVLGFQPGTAFLIYGIWIPAFFTMAVTFALFFNRLTRDGGRQ